MSLAPYQPPSLRQRMGMALARFVMRFSGFGGSSASSSGYWSPWGRLIGLIPGTNINWAKEVGDPAMNTVVAICLNWIADQFTEPVLEVARRKRDKTWEVDERHALPALIEEPNDYYDGHSLMAATVFSYGIDGNAYWVKERGMGGRGRPSRLWFVPHWQMAPRWSQDGSTFITHYEMMVEGKVYPLDVRDVVHFYDRIDPRTRRGVSRLYPALRAVGALNEADTFVYAILKNMGIPGVLISPKDATTRITTETREDMEALWTEGFTGDNRGKPMIPSAPVEVTKLTFSPEELTLDKIRDAPIQLVCGSLRLHPSVVGLSVGGGPSDFDQGGQQEQVRKAAYEDCVIPLQARFARCIQKGFRDDFALTPQQVVRYNYDDVRALQEDEDALHARAVADFQGGLITRNEGRSWIGLPPVKEEPTEQAGPGGTNQEPGTNGNGKSEEEEASSFLKVA